MSRTPLLLSLLLIGCTSGVALNPTSPKLGRPEIDCSREYTDRSVDAFLCSELCLKLQCWEEKSFEYPDGLVTRSYYVEGNETLGIKTNDLGVTSYFSLLTNAREDEVKDIRIRIAFDKDKNLPLSIAQKSLVEDAIHFLDPGMKVDSSFYARLDELYPSKMLNYFMPEHLIDWGGVKVVIGVHFGHEFLIFTEEEYMRSKEAYFERYPEEKKGD